MAIKIGVSGFGRISRVVIRAAMDMPEIEIAGINVRNADKEYMVYMLKYDTVFGRFPKELDVYEDGIIIDGKRVPVYSESDAANIPWSECGAEYIVEGYRCVQHDRESYGTYQSGCEEGYHHSTCQGQDDPDIRYGCKPRRIHKGYDDRIQCVLYYKLSGTCLQSNRR